MILLSYIDPGNGFLLLQIAIAAVIGRLAFLRQSRESLARLFRKIFPKKGGG